MRVSDRLEVGEIISDASELVGAHIPTFLGAAAVYMAFGTWADDPLWSWEMQLVMLCLSVLLGGLLQYLVLRRGLGDAGGGWVAGVLAPVTAILLHFGIWFIAGLGNLLLLLPGLYFASRMSAAVGLAVVERAGLIGSIAGSWRRTRGSTWPLVAVHALLLFPIIALTVAVGVAGYAEYGIEHIEEASTEFAVVTNVIFGILAMAGWAVAGAAYRLTAPARQSHEDMFA